MAHRRVSDEEKKLWRVVTRDVAPFDYVEIVEDPPSLPVSRQEKRSISAVPPVAVQASLETLPVGEFAGLDSRWVKQIKRGDLLIDTRVDLHFMNAHQAYEAFALALDQCWQRHGRCLLVITGKGKAGEGVLRQALPHWVNLEPWRSKILALHPAHARHGGSGAWYVLLKRRRGNA